MSDREYCLVLDECSGKYVRFTSKEHDNPIFARKINIAKHLTLAKGDKILARVQPFSDPITGEVKLFVSDQKNIKLHPTNINLTRVPSKSSTPSPAPSVRPIIKKLPPSAACLAALQTTTPQPAFIPLSDKIAIYIDETWPKMVDQNSGKNIGVIAGIVWNGENPDPKLLPLIRTHLREVGLERVATALIPLHKCACAFPFVIPLSVCGTPEKYYLSMAKATIKLVLGWLLPHPKRQCTVYVHFEKFGGFDTGTNKTENFRGMLEEAKLMQPTRFANWVLGDVCWRDKDFGYIPYADTIAYLANEHNQGVISIIEASNYHQWPGYLPLSLELLPTLSRLGIFDSPSDIDHLLNFVGEIAGSQLSKTIVSDFKQQAANRDELVIWLIEGIERLYQIKSRNLNNLYHLLLAFEPIISSTVLPLRINFLWSQVQLQRANHAGDPDQYSTRSESFLHQRQLLIDFDKELIAMADMNYMVHLNDQFKFKAALRVIRSLHDEFWFPFLPPLIRGRAYSSLGQCMGLTGRHDDAEAFFVLAIGEFNKFEQHGEIVPVYDIDQTSVYRAINAITGARLDAQTLTEKVLGPIEETIEQLATNNSELYHHHLLLRTLWENNYEKHQQMYLSHQVHWKSGDQHPWELIEMYRGLLLFRNQKDNRDGAATQARFDRAIEIVTCEQHGATLQLIGAVIAAVAACACSTCVLQKKFIEQANELRQHAGMSLPEAAIIVYKLGEYLQAPSENDILEILRQLPFNYK